LVGYAVEHFDNEEAIQLEYGFPDYKRHKQLHENFKAVVGNLVSEFEASGSTSDLKRNLNKILVKWLANHIEVEDKKIGQHIYKR